MQPQTLVISRNFLCRIEQHFQNFVKDDNLARYTENFRKIFYRECPSHYFRLPSRFFPNFRLNGLYFGNGTISGFLYHLPPFRMSGNFGWMESTHGLGLCKEKSQKRDSKGRKCNSVILLQTAFHCYNSLRWSLGWKSTLKIGERNIKATD